MNSGKFVLGFIIMYQFMLQLTNQLSLRPKHFKVQRAGSCIPALQHGGKLERFDLSQPTKYRFHLNADVRFLDDVTNPIQFHMKYSKCTLENEGFSCDDHETMKFDNVCDRLNDNNAVWTPLVRIIKPKLSCPIKKGLYTIRNGTLDLSIMARLPVDGNLEKNVNKIKNLKRLFWSADQGWRYVTRISLYETFENETQLQLLCMDSDVTVTVGLIGRPRNKGF